MVQLTDRHRAVGSAPERAHGVGQSSWTLMQTAAGAGRFVLHFAEMWIAMTVGMAIFVPVRLALAGQGYAALVDNASIEYEAWMGIFMTVPMVAWMRLRGHGWRMEQPARGTIPAVNPNVRVVRRSNVETTLPTEGC